MALDDWEQHKVRIVLMYCLEKKSLQQVASYMKEHHDFDKKPNQYEYRFRTWGIKKNATKDVWSYVAHRVQKRKQTNKASRVILYGVSVPEERLRKEIQRYTVIPTAMDFGMQATIPPTPEKEIVRIRSPSVMSFESLLPETLPWFQFEPIIRNLLQKSSGSLTALVTAFGSEATRQQDQRSTTSWPLFTITGNISTLRQAVSDYSKSVPRCYQATNHQPESLARVQDRDSIATDFLEAILFRLSNNLPIGTNIHQSEDQLVVQIVEGLSHSHPHLVSALLSDCSETATAIKEGIYKSAIRQKSYAIVSRLLKCGVDPELPVDDWERQKFTNCSLQRGKIQIHFRYGISAYRMLTARGIEIAAMTIDTRLGKILLDAGANPNHLGHHTCIESWPPLALIGLDSNYKANFDGALEFANMLIEHGATVNPSIPSRYQNLMGSPLDMALARHDNLLAELIIRQGADETLYAYHEGNFDSGGWRSPQLRPLGARVSPLLVAIVSGNSEVTERLLQPVLLQQAQIPRSFIKDLFVASCLAGDIAVMSKALLSLDLDLNEDWVDGVTPLVATAWNPDLTIARLLLAAGAHIGPKRCIDGRDGTTQLTEPSPIHVAAFHGNSELVRILIDRGASCSISISYNKPQSRYYRGNECYTWLLPFGVSSPLNLALRSEDTQTIALLLSHSTLTGGEIAQAITLGDQTIITELISRGADIHFVSEDGTTALESAVEKGNTEVISLFFASGGKYRSSALYCATKRAIESEDHSLVMTLIDSRPPGLIDRHEASCLVLALQEEEWDLVHQLLDYFTSGPSSSFYGLDDENDILTYFHKYHSSDQVAGITPLWAAYLSGNTPIIQRMLQQGYSFQKCDQISFGLSVLEFDDERSVFTTELLLSTSQFEQMNLVGRQMLLLCAIKSYSLEEARVRRVREYIKLMNSLNFAIETGGFCALSPHSMLSPLGLAVSLERLDLVSMLIDAGANVGYVNHEALNLFSALELAVYRDNVEIVKLLIDKETNASNPLSHATAALLEEALGGHLTIANILIDHGADMNSLSGSPKSHTALEQAALLGRLDVVQLFIERGLDVGEKVRIHYVRSVLFARRHGHYVIANLLIKYGSWTQEDQMLYDRPSTGDTFGGFRYDEQSKEWHYLRWEGYLDYRRYNSGWRSTASYTEVGTCDSSSREDESSGQDEETAETGFGVSVLRHETDQEVDDWLRAVVDTFEDPACFDINHEEETDSHGALPLRPGNRVIAEPSRSQQQSDGYGEIEIEELVGNDAEREGGGRQDSVGYEPTTGGQERSETREKEVSWQVKPIPELVIEQTPGMGMELMTWNDPFFGADQIEDVWDI